MPANKQDFAASFREVAERSPPSGEERPSPEKLIDFVEGRLSAEAEDDLRRELAADPEALQVLRDLSAFPDVELRDEEVHRAAEIVPDWQSMKAHLDHVAEAKPPPVTAFPTQPPSEAQPRPPSNRRWLTVAALTLIALVPWLLVRSQRQTISTLNDQIARLEAPTVQHAVFSLRPLDLVVRDPRAQRFAVPASAERVRLVLNVLDTQDVERFQLRLTRADSAEVLWQGVDVRPDAIGLFHLDLPRQLVPEGTYRIDLSGTAADGTTAAIASFRFALDDWPAS